MVKNFYSFKFKYYAWKLHIAIFSKLLFKVLSQGQMTLKIFHKIKKNDEIKIGGMLYRVIIFPR